MQPPLNLGLFSPPGWLSGLNGVGTIIGWALLGVFAIFWLAMLVDCLRRPAFYPIFRIHWRTRVFWLLTFLLFNPVMTLAYLLFGRIARPREKTSAAARAIIVGLVIAIAIVSLLPPAWGPPRAARFARNAETGRMEIESGKTLSSPEISAEAYESSNSLNAATTTAGNADSAFPCEHMLILNNSPHPLLQRVGELLAQQLSAVSSIQTVDLLPPNETIPPGDKAPEMIVLLDATRLEETDLPGYRELQAVVEASAGQVPWSSGIHVFDSSRAPTLDISLRVSLEHSSRTLGIEVGGARYKKAAEDIAGQIGKHLIDAFGKWYGEYGTMSDLPPSFYGPYIPASDVPFPSMPNCKLIISGCALFEHNRAIWRINDPRDPGDALSELRTQLEAQGWEADRNSDSSQATERLSMRSGDRRLQAFVPRRTRHSSNSAEPANRSPIIVTYHHPFLQDERCRAIDDLVASDTSVETLMRFRHSVHECDGGLEGRLYQRAEQGPLTSVRAVVDLAKWQHSRDRKDGAKATLRRAAALAEIAGDWSKAGKLIEDAAKEFGDPRLANVKPSQEDLRQLGLPQITADDKPITSEVGIGERVLGYARPKPNTLIGVQARVLPGDKPDEPFKLSLSACHEGDRVTSTIGLNAPKSGPIRGSHSVGFENCRFQAEVVSTDRRRFVVTVNVVFFEQDHAPASTSSRSLD